MFHNGLGSRQFSPPLATGDGDDGSQWLFVYAGGKALTGWRWRPDGMQYTGWLMSGFFEGMVLAERLELPTARLQIGCSTN